MKIRLLIFPITSFLISVSLFAAESPARLLVIEKQAAGCQFSFQSPADQKVESWFSLPECLSAPENLIFDASSHRALVLAADKYWTVDLKKDSKPVFFADAFAFPGKERLITSQTWFDKSSGRLRVAYLIEVPFTEMDNPDGNWIRKNFPMLGKTWVSKHEEGAGAPSIAVVAELDSNNQWRQLAVKQTTSQADGALGLGVVSAFISEKPGVFSLLNLSMKATCNEQDGASHSPQLSKAVSEWVPGVYKADEQGEHPLLSYMNLGDGDGILVGVVSGDTYHWVKPIFYCQGDSAHNCERHNEMSVDFGELDQISISMNLPYVLITKEYDGSSATLFKKGSIKPVVTYPSDTVVVWLPGEIQ